MPGPLALLRTLPGRILMATLGLLGVALLIQRANGPTVLTVLSTAAVYFPGVVLLTGGMLACETVALWLLYGEDRHHLRATDMMRAALLGYPMMVLLPMGRATAEAMRAGLLTPKTSGARAAAAATRMQGVLLLANAGVSVPCALAAFLLLGPSLLPALICANGVGVLFLGTSLLYGGRRVGVGAFIGRRSRRVGQAGAQFDVHLREGTTIPPAAVLCAFAGRLFQVAEYALLLAAVGGHVGLLSGLGAQGIHLVGAAMGDLIPGQLGATEASYSIWSKALSLSAASALTIALLAHLSQATWATLGSIAALLFPVTERAQAAEEGIRP